MGLETIPSLLSGPWSVSEREALFESRSHEDQQLTLEWMREAEIKHARLAMLAVVGCELPTVVTKCPLPFPIPERHQ